MNIHRLEIFVNLSKTLNYTDTAENLYTTQGNISKQIFSLEKELSVSLFKREHRKIRLTDEGKVILPHAQKIIDDYTSLQRDLNDYQDTKNLTIEMYTIPTMPNYQSFNLITQFLKQHPEIHMQLKEEESNNLFTALKTDKCEIIFARTFSFDDETLERIPMENDEFVAVLPKHHKYAKLSKLDVSKLSHDNFLILGKSTNLYEPVINLCHIAGFNPTLVYEGSRVDLIIQMVESNMGVSILMKKTVDSFKNDKFVTVPLTSSIENELGFFKKKGNHSEASEIFWDFIKNSTK